MTDMIEVITKGEAPDMPAFGATDVRRGDSCDRRPHRDKLPAPLIVNP